MSGVVQQDGHPALVPPATVLEIQRMSTEDGPGIRTTVFFKGCSLACDWCHNPESIPLEPQRIWHDWKCIACGACVDVCPADARTLGPDGAAVDPERCQSCGACVDECPTTAIERLGERWELDTLVAEVAKDRSYFEASGGGVTVSGGEPVLQADFVAPFLAACRAAGLHTALDTCGQTSTARLLRVAAEADLVLFDLKHADTATHRRLTGHGNDRILANLAALRDQMRRDGAPSALWIRTPLIPGATDSAENVRGIGELLTLTLGELVERWELCAFNNLCGDKYRRLDKPWPYAGTPLMSATELDELAAVARRTVCDPDIVIATGRTRTESAAEGSEP